MKKKRSQISDFVQYAALSALVVIIQPLPLNFCMMIGRCFAYACYLFDRKRRAIAEENLRKAYGTDLSDIQRRRIIRSNYLHLASVGIDFIKLPQLVNGNNWRKYFDVEGLEFAREALEQEKGIIFVSGHLGSWEVLGCAMKYLFHQPVHSIAKHMENPFSDRFVTKLRENSGQKIIFTENASREILRVLKNNQLLGILIDQNVRENNIIVDFFGQKAATTRSVATLSLKTGAPVIMLFARRVDRRYRFKVTFSKPIQIQKTENQEKDIFNLTQKCTSIIESRIREHPHEWIWIHNRWKTRPPIVARQ